MKPVFQRIISAGRGDCMTAAIASVLELPYEQVPTWIADAFDAGQPYAWHPAFTKWLAARGLFYLTIQADHLNDWRNLVGAYAIATVPSQKFPGVTHAVVVTWEDGESGGKRMVYVHDPNPSNQPYGGIDPIRLSFLVPINPAGR